MSEAGFPRKLRLTSSAEFNAVFGEVDYKAPGRYLLLFAKNSGLDHARLGLVLGKKHVPRAVDRNRLKRVLRASFRQQQDLLAGLDIVILARNELGTLASSQLHTAVIKMWQELQKKRSRIPVASSGSATPEQQ